MMKTSKVSFRLSPNEEAFVLQKERDRRRKLRIQQVREQERAFAKLVRKQVEVKKKQELSILADQLEQEWLETKLEEKETLDQLYRKTLESVGRAHASAKEQPPVEEIRERAKVENFKKAKERGIKAIQKQQKDDEEKTQEEFALIMARKTALEIERARAALIAKKPHLKSEESQADPVKQPTRVLHQEGFSTTHYTIPHEYVERADPEEQGDAKKAAIDEEERVKEETEEKQQEMKERQTKAALRQKHAQEKERLNRARTDLMEELSQMEQADRRRRQLIVSNIPKQIFQPPHKRLEEKEDHQKDLEEAFENMYMAKTDYVGDLELALEPALPQVEADLDLSSDSPGEVFQLPDKKVPKKFPQGLDESDRRDVPAKKDTLKKLLRKIHSQKQDHRMRKQAELVGDVLDTPSLAPSVSSVVPSSALSSEVTPSSVMDDSGHTEVSSSQVSSQLSQHPLSSGTTSQTTTNGADSLETGTISEGSSDAVGVTLMHPLEEARKVRGKEQQLHSQNSLKESGVRQTGEHSEAFEMLPSEPLTPFTRIPSLDPPDDTQEKASVEGNYSHTIGTALNQEYNGQPFQDTVRYYPTDLQHDGHAVGDRITSGLDGGGLHASVPPDVYHPHPLYTQPSVGDDTKRMTAVPPQRKPLPYDYRDDSEHLRTRISHQELPTEYMPHHHIRPMDVSQNIGQSSHDIRGTDGQQGDDFVQHATLNRLQRGDNDKLGRKSGTVGQAVRRSHPGTVNNKNTVQKGESVQRYGSAPNEFPESQPQRIHQEQGVDVSSDNISVNSIEAMPPSHLESVRQKYPNIYETLTGRKPLAGENKESLSSSHELSINNSLPVHPRHKAKGHNSLDIVNKPQPDDVTRQVTLRKVPPSKRGDKVGISVEDHTADEQESVNYPKEITFEKASKPTNPSAEFQSLLHEYQQQLLKLQRTNEAEIMEAQSKLQKRRQRLLELYPLSNQPLTTNGIHSKQETLIDVKSGSREHRLENMVGEPPTDRGVFVTRLPREENQGYNSSSGTLMSLGSESRYSNSSIRDKNYREYETDPKFPIREQYRIPEATVHQAIQHINSTSVSQHGPITRPNVSYFNPPESMQGMNSQSFGTPPLYQDQIRNGSQSKPADFSRFLPLSPKSSTTEEQSSQYVSPLTSVTPEPLASAFRVVSSQEKVREVPGQIFSEPDKHDIPSGDVPRRSGPISFQEDLTSRESDASAQVTWRPVKKVHVSLPSAADEQSPLSSSVAIDDNSPFLKSPSSAGKSKALDSDVLEQGLLTPRKLTQLKSNPFASRGYNMSLDNRQQGQRSSPLEPVSPGKLITPKMLLGNQIDKQGNKVAGLTAVNESSAKGYGSNLMAPSSSQRPHSDDDQHKVFNKESTVMPTNENLASGQDNAYNNEGLEQHHFSGTTGSGLTQAHSLPSLHMSQSTYEQMDVESTLASTIASSLQNIRETSKFGPKQTFFSHEWHDSAHYHALSGKCENQDIVRISDLSLGEESVIRKDTRGASETDVSAQQGYEHQLPDQERKKNLSSDDRTGSLEEPTDTGLLEALKNLMLAKARSQVPGAATTATNFFGHLDLTNFDRSENDPVGMKDEAEVRKDIEAGKNVDIHEPVTEMETKDETEDEIDRQKLHHRPPMASYSKLMAFDEVAPHELSTIIEVESPLFETLPELSLTNGNDTRGRLDREVFPPLPSSNDGTSSSSWGTPQHHESAFSKSSGTASPRDIYIHGPTVASSLEEGESFLFKNSLQTNVRNEPKSNQPPSDMVTDIFNGVSAPMKHLAEVTSKERLDEDVTISEGPLNSSSEASIDLSETMGEDCQVQKDPPEHRELFPLSAEVLRLRNVSSEAAETKGYSIEPPQPNNSQRERNSRDGKLLDTVVSQSMKESGVSANSFESSRFTSQSAVGTSLQSSTLQSAMSTSVQSSTIQSAMGTILPSSNLQSAIGTSRQSSTWQSAVSTSVGNSTLQSAMGISLQSSTLQSAMGASMDLSSGATSDARRSFNDGENLSGYGGTYVPPFHESQQKSKLPSVSHIADSQKSHEVVTPLEEGPLENTLEETRMTIVSQEDNTFHMLLPQETISESVDSPPEAHQSRDDDSEKITSLKHLGIDRRSFTPGASPARFFSEVAVHQSAGTADSETEEWSQKHSRRENEIEPVAVERGIMEEPELTFQTTFDTNVTLGSVIGEPIEGAEFASPSESLLSFIKHEEQFAHSTPMKSGNLTRQRQETAVKADSIEELNQNSNAGGGPLTLQEALARHKAGFIKASKARQVEVKEQRKSEMQSGTAFAMTLKNWQKARLQAQHKNRRKGVKKSSSSNKENVARTGTAQKVKTSLDRKEAQKVNTSQDRKEAQIADKERTKRLYNQLEEVRQRQAEAQRQKTYAENRKKRKEYEEKLRKRRILLKSQAQPKT